VNCFLPTLNEPCLVGSAGISGSAASVYARIILPGSGESRGWALCSTVVWMGPLGPLRWIRHASGGARCANTQACWLIRSRELYQIMSTHQTVSPAFVIRIDGDQLVSGVNVPTPQVVKPDRLKKVSQYSPTVGRDANCKLEICVCSNIVQRTTYRSRYASFNTTLIIGPVPTDTAQS
jgi:hypothetical protein